jgi:hypothetical protein
VKLLHVFRVCEPELCNKKCNLYQNTDNVEQRKRLTKIDTLLGKLTEEGRQEFSEFVSVDRKLSDIQRWWSERGLCVSISVVNTWRQKHYQAGTRAKALLAFVSEARGINAMQLLEYAVCESAFTVDELRRRIDDSEEYYPRDVILLLRAIKELRSSAESLNNAKIRADRTTDILSGAYELCRKALTAAKDHPNEQWLEELLNGELRATEDELIKEQIKDAQ